MGIGARITFGICGIIFLLSGLICLLFPLVVLFDHDVSYPPYLLRDTRAHFGGGPVAEGVKARQVACAATTYANTGRENSEYECRIYLSGKSSATIERTTGADVSGVAPKLYRVGPGSKDFAVSWGTSELVWRWLAQIGLLLILMVPFGLGLLWVTWMCWGAVRGPRYPTATTPVKR